MAVQTSATGSLEYIQGIVIASCLYTAEYASPLHQLISRFHLDKGSSTFRVPKVGQATMEALTEGIDIVTEQDMGLSYKDIVPGEVGGKFILTDKLVRQASEDLYRVIGRQLGDGMSRKKETDIIALFSALNGGTTIGKTTATLGLAQAMGCVAWALSNKVPNPISFVHHPNTISALAKSASAVGAANWSGMSDAGNAILKNFLGINVNGVGFYHSGNITATANIAVGAIFSKAALGIVESLVPTVERERDASLRATEIVMVSDYSCFELDDAYGAPATYLATALATS